MNLTKSNSEIYAPGQGQPEISKATDLCIAAHQDDIEIMAYSPIAKCYGRDDKWFMGVVVSDGAGSPRSGVYEKYTDEEMKSVRVNEQKQAADIGGYSALALLGFKSSEIKDAENEEVVQDIKSIILSASPDTVYTHNLADKHDTHVAVCLRVIQAIRELPEEARPKRLYGMEVWRGLDWLCDSDKDIFDTSERPNLAAALLGVFDSQITGGKRYDLAALGRRTANATFFESHNTDSFDSLTFGIDLSRLIEDTSLDVGVFISSYIQRFSNEISGRIGKLLK